MEIMEFAEILNDLIEESGFSVRELARVSHVSATQYCEYLHGAFPTIKNAIKLANYFNCSLNYLFGISDKKEKFYKNLQFDKATFLERYAKLLEENHISHFKFAQANHFSESSIRQWRKGQIPNTHTLIIIAKELSSSIDFLVSK